MGSTFFCYTLEDKDRGLDSKMSISEIKEKKIAGDTCIPYGQYKVIINLSPTFGRMLPLLQGVPGFELVRMHNGNSKVDTRGCILVGTQYKQNQVLNSKTALDNLMSELGQYKNILITIKKYNNNVSPQLS
jgi:hypothetical protein